MVKGIKNNTFKYFFLGFTVLVVCILPELAQAADFDCIPVEIRQLHSRIHVKCERASSHGVQYFAVASDSSHRTKLFTSLATAALLSQKIFSVSYSLSTAANVPGCNSNCRWPNAFGVKNR